MRPDQLDRLEDMAEQLADAFLLEADPQSWAGAGASPEDWTAQIRGDRVWMKKNAIATGGVLAHTLNLIKHHRERQAGAMGPYVGDQPDELDRKIADAERRAKEATERALKRAQRANAQEG